MGFQEFVDKVFHKIKEIEDFLLFLWTGRKE